MSWELHHELFVYSQRRAIEPRTAVIKTPKVLMLTEAKAPDLLLEEAAAAPAEPEPEVLVLVGFAPVDVVVLDAKAARPETVMPPFAHVLW